MSLTQGGARPAVDRAAIGLSLVCAIHCLALPVVIVLAPAVGSLAIADESFHLWLALLVLPLSGYALIAGFREHQSTSVFATGCIGLLLLIAAAVVGHELLGEIGEKVLTLCGATIIAYSHIRNFRACRTLPESQFSE